MLRSLVGSEMCIRDRVYLDEPSTGMDPAAKRAMWDLISNTMRDRAVVLTTHSMEEADVLCQRIAIMVNGRFGCLGSSQHLKSLYGKDYIMELSLKNSASPQAGDRLHQFVHDNICTEATLTERPYGELRVYSIPAGKFALAQAFDSMEQNKLRLEVENYSICQTSLEQVFIRFSKLQHDREDL
eukprot:TRINITY_DN2725_c0_g1_i2.p1 TRINITY_DN2725_c0_g1~~TRINITY_DN2725_c0_g1_i2.p1  ORF type:complete len:184 (-),score=61.05 TRINITY_DN2725_c0_g1_i2:220-771(-)